MKESLKVLLVDDSEDDRELCVRVLNKMPAWDCSVTEIESGEEAVSQLREGGYQLILMDNSMPGMTGLDLLSDITLRFPDTPVVMITGSGNEQVAVEALRNGAQDYIAKDKIALEALTNAITRALNVKKQEREIIRHAYYDDLTGLANRRMYDERLTHMIAQAGQTERAFTVVFCDLDGFKAVNDTYGHEVGDILLKQVSERLGRHIREGDLLARIGGDEFVALIHCLPNGYPDADEHIVETLSSEIRGRPFIVGDQSVRVGLSCGLAVFPKMAGTRAELLRLADQAMYAMKQRTKANGCHPRPQAKMEMPEPAVDRRLAARSGGR